MLSYHKACADACDKSILCIFADGLDTQCVIADILTRNATNAKLTLVLNVDGGDRNRIFEIFNVLDLPLPKVLTAESHSTERTQIYTKGGVVMVTARVLVADLLNNRVPSDIVQYLILDSIEGIHQDDNDAFCIRLLYRCQRDICVVALTSRPVILHKKRHHNLQYVLDVLGAYECIMLSRTHEIVDAELRTSPVEVVEMAVAMSNSMKLIQDNLNEVISAIMYDVSRINGVDTSAFTTTTNNNKARLISAQLRTRWHQLGPESRSLVTDLATMENLSTSFSSCDCVTLLRLLDIIFLECSTRPSVPAWAISDAFDKLMMAVKERVYSRSSRTSTSESIDVILEANPKWSVLSDVLHECESDGNVIIFVDDLDTVRQLNGVLSLGAMEFLKVKYERYRMFSKRTKTEYAGLKASRASEDSFVSKKRGPGTSEDILNAALRRQQRRKKKSKLKQQPVEQQPAEPAPADDDDDDDNNDQLDNHGIIDEVIDVESDGDGHGDVAMATVCQRPVVIIRADPNRNQNVLEDLEPRTVILFNPNLCLVRQLEALKIYLITYDCSNEEQRFMATVKAERDAFESFAAQKSSIIVHPDLHKTPTIAPPTIISNVILSDRMNTTPVTSGSIIVDIREFRSFLPSVLERSGFKLIVGQLSVGDYILAPEICVERKRIDDLISSLMSGRLYSQCMDMVKFYRHPVLLIEFEDDGEFGIQNIHSVPKFTVAHSITSKIALLTLHFPSLCIVWSRSPSHSSRLIGNLKKNQPEPELELAMSVGTSDGDDSPLSLVQRMPGVSTQAAALKIASKFDNITSLNNATNGDLVTVLEDVERAKNLFQFLRHK